MKKISYFILWLIRKGWNKLKLIPKKELKLLSDTQDFLIQQFKSNPIATFCMCVLLSFLLAFVISVVLGLAFLRLNTVPNYLFGGIFGLFTVYNFSLLIYSLYQKFCDEQQEVVTRLKK